MKPMPAVNRHLFHMACATVAAFVTGCASPPPTRQPLPMPPAQTPPVTQRAPAPAAPLASNPAPASAKAAPEANVPAPAPISAWSAATTPKDYRRDAAQHLYARNQERIFKGKLPPLLYAIGVLQVEVDSRGMVTSTHWMRSPQHAPEVMAEIERTVRQAAPYPAPVRLGRVTYTDTWLWHKSGLFQLDTLSEGQL